MVKRVDEISSDLAQRYKKNAQMDRKFNDDDIDRAVTKGRYGSDADSKQASADMMRLQRANSKRTKGINRANKRIGEADGVSDADRNPSIERSKYQSNTSHRKPTDADREKQDANKGLPMDDMSIAKRKKERAMRFEAATPAADKYRVTAKSNDDDAEFNTGVKSKADAETAATKMKKQTRKDGAKMYNSVKVVQVKESKLTEGVLDDVDDDGFMAKRQLYDIAKYSVALHRMIQDTDNLEPWISAKITKAADYIDTVKHYLEYNEVRDSGDMAGEVGLDDIAGIDQSLDQMGPDQMEQEVMEFDSEFDDQGNSLTGDDLLRMMVARRVISIDSYNNPSEELASAAEWYAQDIGPVSEIGSSDVSIWVKGLVGELNAVGIALDGSGAHLYESQIKAKSIYKKMLKGLK
jgi:hypothetical protein